MTAWEAWQTFLQSRPSGTDWHRTVTGSWCDDLSIHARYTDPVHNINDNTKTLPTLRIGLEGHEGGDNKLYFQYICEREIHKINLGVHLIFKKMFINASSTANTTKINHKIPKSSHFWMPNLCMFSMQIGEHKLHL